MCIKKLFAVLLTLSLLLPLPVFAVDQADLLQKIDSLSKELDRLKQQIQEVQKQDTVKEQRITVVEKKAEEATGPSWLEIGGDYRFRFDNLQGTVQGNSLSYSYNPATPAASKTSSYTMSQLFQLGGQYPNLFTLLGPTMAPMLQQLGLNPATATPPQIYQAVAAAGMLNAPSGFGSYTSAVANDYKLKDNSLMTNRFGLNLKAKATEDVQVKARLLMYKAFGNDFVDTNNVAFADKFVAMDGNAGHLPKDNALLVDQAYATWSNVFGAPAWFSVGRRPSTGGVPTNIRQNTERTGTAGVPGLLVDYAFDGGTIGFAPDIAMLPGAYMKFCYGKGMDTGLSRSTDATRFNDVQMYGVNIVPYDTDKLHVELQWQKGKDIFAFPGDTDPFGLGNANKNIGDITWWGAVLTGKVDKAGPGNLNWFVTGAMSTTHPNDNTYDAPFIYYNTAGSPLYSGHYGLLYDDTNFGGEKKDRTGQSIYLGARYDITSTGTKIGAEYNRGSQYWMAFTPASDDMWTSKLATRGSVYELYIIQQLNKRPIAKRGDAFFRLGYQHYNFDYTGSGFWLGAPRKISDLNSSDPATTQILQPVKTANDVFLTFDVVF